jgi:signal transduction histidine kinase
LQDTHAELATLADYLDGRREAVTVAWQDSVREDPVLITGHSLPRPKLIDHIPLLLAAFEKQLRALAANYGLGEQGGGQEAAAAHGLERWKQGYPLREVVRELGKLNECVVAELERFATLNANMPHTALSFARRVWAKLCGGDIEASISEYFNLQQVEAAGHVHELEQAQREILDLERERGELWRQAAHDLRGNLGVVVNVTAGLRRHPDGVTRNEFVRILMRSLTSFHHLIDDVTGLARLQAGHEKRVIESFDAATVMQELCESMRPLAEQRRLFLRSQGPRTLEVGGDLVKVRRIAQNLILNALKYTREGGVTVSWEEGEANDPTHWVLRIKDTGPGFISATRVEAHPEGVLSSVENASASEQKLESHWEEGEGIGLSIVKRLCELLDATMEMQSIPNEGTTFLISFPRHYAV